MSVADQLKEAAAAAPKAPAPTAEASGTAVAAVEPGRRMTRADMQANVGSSVSTYLKVSEHGITIGKETKLLVKSFAAKMPLREIKYCTQVRFGKNPVQYFKTYDNRITAGTGRPWQKTLEQAKAFDAGKQTDPFSTAELVIVVAGPVLAIDGSKVPGTEVGTRIGYTPPYTGVANFNKFLDDVTAAGLDADNDTVDVTIGYEAQSKNGNDWGNVTFTLIGKSAE